MPPMPAVGSRIESRRFGSGIVVRCLAASIIAKIDRLAGLELDVPLADLVYGEEEKRTNASAAGAPTSPAEIARKPDSVASMLGAVLDALDVPAEPSDSREDQTAGRPIRSIFDVIDLDEPIDDLAGRNIGRPLRSVFEILDPPEAVVDLERQNARRSIEALRFGIVPANSIQAVTVGYDSLKRWVMKQLPAAENCPKVSEVCGRFGTGKSHAMAAIRHISEGEGYVHAQVEIDGNEISLSDPAGVLRQLWKTLSAKGLHSNTPLLELMGLATGKGTTRARRALERFPRIQHNLLLMDNLSSRNALDAHSENLELILACSDEITGVALGREILIDPRMFGAWQHADVPAAPKVIIGRVVDERPADFVNCLLGYAVLAELAGYKGLVVTIDEFEVEYTGNRTRRWRLGNVMNTLSASLQDEGKSGSVPLAVFIATVGQAGEDRDEYVDELVESTGGARHLLKAWNRTLQLEVAERITALYGIAYGLEIEYDQDDAIRVLDNLEEHDGSSVIRSFIKGYVADLDYFYGPPHE